MSRSFKTEAARKAAHQRRDARHSKIEWRDNFLESKDQARTMPTYPVDAGPQASQRWPLGWRA